MLKNLRENEELKLQELSPEEKSKRGILGRLTGPIASFTTSTRNGRGYDESLWENAFNSDLIKEMFSNGGLPGELEHPADRTQTDPREIAIMMPEPPRKDKNGHLCATVDILDTPNGRIAYQLAKYGFNLGISSRGEGDIIEDFNGNDKVDPNTYTLNAFDLVLLPACKDARLKFTESLEVNKKTFKQAITESLEKASDEDRKIMENTLKSIEDKLNEKIDPRDYTKAIDAINQGIKDDQDTESLEKYLKDIVNYCKSIANDYDLSIECNNESCSDINEVKEEKLQEEVADSKSVVITELQEALKMQKELKAGTEKLQNQLAVSDAKVTELSGELSKYKNLAEKLSSEAANSKKLNTKVQSLNEELKSSSEKSATFAEANEALKESLVVKNKKINSLTEELHKSNSEVIKLTSDVTKLTEELEDLKSDQKIKFDDYSKKINKATKLAEAYKKATNTIMNRYIESKADMLGISVNEIKNRLGNSYTPEDVDILCEELQSYRLNISRLPFNVNDSVKVKFTESKNDSLRVENLADEIDDDLLMMAKL